jgi:hypothetical protein
MKAIYNHIPAMVEAVGDGTWYFRWDLQELISDTGIVSYQCNEVIVSDLTANQVKKTVISELWGHDVEAKLLNDYYAAIEGVLPESYKQPYLNFLIERKNIKFLIDETLNVL